MAEGLNYIILSIRSCCNRSCIPFLFPRSDGEGEDREYEGPWLWIWTLAGANMEAREREYGRLRRLYLPCLLCFPAGVRMNEHTLLYKAFSVGPGQSVRPNDLLKKKRVNYLQVSKKCLPLHPQMRNALLAQLVEQLTLNQWVQGSNP